MSPAPIDAPRFSRLSPAECARLHAASLQILERTGVRLFEPEAVDLARRAGARVEDGNRVRFPAQLVERALRSAPREITLHNRRGASTMPVGGNRAFFGPGSDCLHIVDHRTGQRRRARLADVADGITLADALPNIDFVMSMFLPEDVDPQLADRFQMEVMLNRTAKPLVFVTYDLAGCQDVIAMAEAVAGGAQALQARPFLAAYLNVTTGLLHNAEALQKLLFLAERNLPALYIPVVSSGTTGPMTLAGSLALTNAGVLVGVTLAQLRREGAPVIVPGFAADALDLRTLVDPYCGPDARGLAEALGHAYGLPIFSLAGASDAKLPDQQAALEAALTLAVSALSGGHIVHDLGYLESGLSGSLAQLAICDEIVAWLKHYRQELEITDETLALDLIDEIGPDGQFLDTEHTQRHYRERFYPDLIERYNYPDWLEHGGLTLAERAAQRVDEILATHQPEPLPAGAARAVHAVVERAEARARD